MSATKSMRQAGFCKVNKATAMNWRKTLRKIGKWGPWNYRFWREAMRRPYNIAFKTPPVADDALTYFPEAEELRANFAALRAEAVAVATGTRIPSSHEYMSIHDTFFKHDQIPWNLMLLRAYGYDYHNNQARTPLMTDFLRRNKHVVSAAISVFPPGKRLRPHRGPFKAVWRYHMAYLVSDLENGGTSCELDINGQTYHLREGQDLIWDDTYIHSARNQSDKPRIVLLLDVYRRDHPWWIGWLSRLTLWIAKIVQGVMRLNKHAAAR